VSVRDEVLQLLGERPDGMTDAQLAERLGKRHQHVNQCCRLLVDEGRLIRDSSSGTIVNRLVGATRGPTATPPPVVRESSTDRAWPHEAAVQGVLVGWLVREGWRIVRVADTETRERGTDVIAERGGVRLLVEVKGYPGATYARGPNAGEPKPTAPTLQASHWLAGAIFKAMRMRGADDEARVVVALPDAARYGALLTEVDQSLRGARIEAWMVTGTGEPSARFGAWPEDLS
jgi:hypothetical protein